jgi:hypothetical protein
MWRAETQSMQRERDCISETGLSVNRNEMEENEISKELVDIFIRVHSALGPGLLESVYETAVCYELTKRNMEY